MCKKVLVFTCYDKWSNNLPSDVKTKEFRDAYPDEETPIKKCQFPQSQTTNTKLVKIDLDNFIDEEGVYLVYDEINDVEFKKLKDKFEGDELYVLFHSNGRNDFHDWKVASKLPGNHNKESNGFYCPLFRILADNEGDKLSRIIDTIFKPVGLEDAILYFLDGCTIPSNDDEAFVSAYHRLLAENEIANAVKGFYENAYSKSNQDSFNALCELRERLNEYVNNTKAV